MNSKYKYLIKNTGILAISNFSSKLLVFFLVPIYTSVLSTAEYGTYDLAMSTVLLLYPVLTVNIVDGVMRFSMEKGADHTKIISIALRFIFVGMFIMTVLLYITVVVAEGMTQMTPGITGMLIRLLGALILLIMMYPMFGYLILPVGLLLLGVNAVFRKILKKLHKQVQEADGNLRIFLQESLAGMLVIRVFGKEKQIVENANEKMAGHKKARMRRNHISNLCNSGFNGAMNVAYVVGTAVGGYGILTGTITYGTLMAMIQLIGQLQSPFASLTGFFPQYYGMLASAERIREIEEYPVDQIGGEKKTAEQIQEFYRKKLKGLVLKDAKFSYISSESDQKDTRPVVLEHINLEIPKGVYVALTGPSGCGKSTLLKVLMCLYHLDQGEYQLKVETQTEPMTSKWRSLFAYVP